MDEICQVNIIHKEKVTVIKAILGTKNFSKLLVLGKCFSDSSRIKIFYALATILDTSIVTTSHHLHFFKSME